MVQSTRVGAALANTFRKRIDSIGGIPASQNRIGT